MLIPKLACRISLLATAAISIHAESIISTVAGKGRILTGVGGQATGVPLGGPIGMAFDSRRNLYIADNQQNVVFKVQPDGTINVFAGSGVRGFAGDGGPAIAAALMEPRGVAVDTADNVYIADYHNERIRKVDQKGIITTFAGGGAASNTDEIPATAVTVFEPGGMAFDSAGALYFCEGGSSQIRKITPDGIIHHVAGNGGGFAGDGGQAANAKFAFPQGIAFDSKGNLYIADQSNNRVRKIDTKGNISTVAGSATPGFAGDGGPAISASLTFPTGVAVDAAGNLYIADSINNRVRKVTPAGTISTVAGAAIHPPIFSGDGGPATSASLNLANAVALDPSGNLYISDQNNRRIRRVDLSGSISTFAGSGVTNFSGDGGQATQAAMDFPTDVKVDGAGNLYVADAMNHRIRKITPAGVITTIAGKGTVGFSGDGGQAVSAQLNAPVSVAIDSTGNVYISDQQNLRIRRVTPAGVISTYAGNGFYGSSGDGGAATSASLAFPGCIAVDASQNLYITEANTNRVRKVTPEGIISTAAGNGNAGFSGDGGPATAATLTGPFGVAVDGAGNLFITDAGNRAVRKVARDGRISTVVNGIPIGLSNIEGLSGNSDKLFLDGPDGITADNQGNVYFDAGWHIYRVNSAGIVTLLTGGGLKAYQEGFDGDGGPSVAAHLTRDTTTIFSPVMGMTVDGAGNLYVADSGNDRIRKITNSNSAAQLAITTPDSFALYPSTGADVPDLFLSGNSSEPLNIINVGSGPMDWTATASPADGCTFLQLSSSAGSAPSTITVTVNTANVPPGRYWCTFQISAAGATNSPRYVSAVVTVPIPFLNGGASSGTYTVKEQAGVGWFASSPVNWITITSQPSGQGSGSFSYSVAANTSSAERAANMTVAGAPIFVRQFGGAPAIQAIVDAFDYTPGVAPGAWVTITGTSLATGTPQTWDLSGTTQLPTRLGGTTVTFNGAPAALYYVSPTQINALVPASVAPGPLQVVVQANGVNSDIFKITASSTLPSIYALPNSDGSAFFVTAALAGTGTLVGNSAVDPRVTRAALPGDVLDLYMAGLGATIDPSGFITNQVFAGAYPVSAAVTASVGGKAGQVLFAGLTSPGLYLVRVALPSDLPPGPQAIQVSAGGKQTRPSLMLMVGAP